MAANNKKLTTAEFIEKARTVHGARYDYSQAIYRSFHTHLRIICSLHGAFIQAPSKHLSGQGCRACGRNDVAIKLRHSLAEFIELAEKAHGKQYDYSLCISYKKQSDRMQIICPAHGVFVASATNHTSGKGCPKCGDLRAGDKRRMPRNTFLEQAAKVHNGKYDYTSVVYKTSHAQVIIKCPIHGEFNQSPSKHLLGRGCQVCGGSQLRTTQEWVGLARLAHGDKYDYSEAHYTSAHTKLNIICPLHGAFKQTADSHLNGNGCAKCWANRKREGWVANARGRAASLYFVKLFCDGECFYKIGVTYSSVDKRYSGKRDNAAYRHEVLALYTSQNAAAVYDWEQSILETFTHLRYKPRRRFGGRTECFSSCEEILAIFPIAG